MLKESWLVVTIENTSKCWVTVLHSDMEKNTGGCLFFYETAVNKTQREDEKIRKNGEKV